MLSRWQKQAFYNFAGPIMALNGRRHRLLSSPKIDSDGKIKIHLGPGMKNYLEGWTNVDANMFTGKCDMWADIRNPLPFADECADALYSHHVIEHLPDLSAHFKDALRVLKPGGTYRVGGPNGDAAVRKFIDQDLSWFGDFPDKYESIGGRFVNYIFCRNEHLTMLSLSFLQEIAKEAGFLPGVQMLPRKQTSRPELFEACLLKENVEDDNFPRTLIIEFRKP